MFRFLLLGLLAERPCHGYELKHALDRFFPDDAPVNVGRVYATLSRLERDRLVEHEVVAQGSMPDRKVFSLTDAGWDELVAWLGESVRWAASPRRELSAKVLLNVRLDIGDPVGFIWRQRQQFLEQLARYERQRTADGTEPLAALLIDGYALEIDAALRWLDDCESRLSELKRCVE